MRPQLWFAWFCDWDSWALDQLVGIVKQSKYVQHDVIWKSKCPKKWEVHAIFILRPEPESTVSFIVYPTVKQSQGSDSRSGDVDCISQWENCEKIPGHLKNCYGSTLKNCM